MQKVGSFLVVIGLMAVVLHFFNYAPRLLVWIYNWGNGPAWAIKIGIIVLGAALYLMGSPKQTGAQE